MNRECVDKVHVFWGIRPDTWDGGSLTITLDKNEQAVCFCGRFNLVTVAPPPPLCDDCHHPEQHHLHGWCYGPKNLDEDDCDCQRFIAPPDPILPARRIVV